MAATGKRHFPHTTPDTAADAVYQEITAGAAHVLPDIAAQVKQGNVYSVLFEPVAAGGASTFTKQGLFNPAASGVYVAITKISIANTQTQNWRGGFYGTRLSTNNTEAIINRLSSGAAGSATADYEATATNVINGNESHELRTLTTLGDRMVDYNFDYPILIDENNGWILHIQNANTASSIMVWEWVEIAK